MARIRTEEEKEAARQAAKQAKKDQWLRELSLIHIFSYISLVFHSREWNCIKTKRKRK